MNGFTELEEKESTCSTEKQPEFFLHGVRLWVAGAGLAICIFLPTLEISIVSTSLITLGNELHGFDQTPWIPNAYILTYSGFLMIWSRCGDIFGVRASLLTSLAFFVAFSGGCGAVQNLNELIICRAFQGIGAAGVFALSTFGFLRLMHPSRYGTIAALAGVMISLGLVLGPICGGAINNAGGWRWIFLLNVPAGAVAWLCILIAMPYHYPHPPPLRSATNPAGTWMKSFLKNQGIFLRQVDFLGAFLILAASMLLVAALQEGTVDFTWSSGVIISFFVVSGALWVAFLAWIWFLSRRSWAIHPILPWRLTKSRVFMGCVLGWFLTGPALVVSVIELPQRYQTVNKSSPLGAGVKLLAYSLSNPVGGIISSTLMTKFKVPFVYTLGAGWVLQSVGFFLMSEIPTTVDLWLGQFGYFAMFGLGIGITGSALYMLVPESVDEPDQLIAMGTATQGRQVGGALGVAIATTMLNTHLTDGLASFLAPEQIDAVKDTAQAIDKFPEAVQIDVRRTFAEAYNLQMKMVGGFALAQVLVIAMIWKKHQIRIVKPRSAG
ncbi:MFS general substrate transporter [Aspergillus steynii IBT 23096]|uniref:MFS general substrate transporter n=1 Tax=Aspergillus steynii IBT 23096 TaxID=1392250 RepID=A0A2I2GF22_9EURO|nr:MFS general substrate transporter [Aspergillus steynii IBT 23096]PLB51489.1 MFS general substrate transporter [Aspergillus steynii IBT 23096]